MALDEQLRELANRVPPPPPGDATNVFRRGRRRRYARHVVTVTAAVSVVAVLGLGATSRLDTQPRLPEVADQPDQTETGDADPAGWVVLRAGELEVSVPPDWQVDTVEPAPDPDAQSGPCAYDLYGGIGHAAGEMTAPLAVVYPMETTGACRAIGLPDRSPEQPSLVLYAGIATGWDDDAPSHGATEERIGSVDMLRLEGEPHGHFAEFRRRDGQGGLLVSHPDDPIVKQVLESLRTSGLAGEQTNDEQAERDGVATVCAAPGLQPSYLPWLEDGDEVPAPTHVHHGTHDDPNGRMVWAEDPTAFDPEGYSRTNFVTIASLAENEPIEPHDLSTEVRGTPAELVWIGFGNVSVTWSESPAPCETYAVHLSLFYVDGTVWFLDVEPSPDEGDDIEAVGAAIERELLRIADSLTSEEEPTT